MLNINLCIRIVFTDHGFYGIGNTAGYSITSSCSCGIIHLCIFFHFCRIDALSLEHTGQFFKGNNKVNIGPDGSSAGLKFLRRARTDKYNTCIRMVFLNLTRCGNHWSKCIGDTSDGLGEELLGQY